jgi:hypothetical protein
MSDQQGPNNRGDKEQPAKKQKIKQSNMGDFLDPSKCFRMNKKTGRIETFKVTNLCVWQCFLVFSPSKCNRDSASYG